MENLLINEYPLLVLPKLAQEVGLNEAIVLQHIHYLVRDFEKVRSGENFKDGHYWVSNTYKVWHEEHFPFWSLKTVERVIGKLEADGLLISSTFNDDGFDNTKWYRINYDTLSERWGGL